MAATEPRQLKKIANDTGRAAWKRPLCQQRWSRTQCRPSRNAHGRGGQRVACEGRDPGQARGAWGGTHRIRGTSSGAVPFSPRRACRRSGSRPCEPRFRRCSGIRISSRPARNVNLMVDGAAGEEIDETARETLRLPQDVAEDRADDAIASRPHRHRNRFQHCRDSVIWNKNEPATVRRPLPHQRYVTAHECGDLRHSPLGTSHQCVGRECRTTKPAASGSRGLSMAASQLNITPSTPMGANIVPGGVTFRTWAPAALEAYIALRQPTGTAASAFAKMPADILVKDAEGYWAGFLPGVLDGDRYRFWVVGTGGRLQARSLCPRTESGPDTRAIASSAIPRAIPGTTRVPRAGLHDLLVYQFHIGVFYAEDDQGQDLRPGRVARSSTS